MKADVGEMKPRVSIYPEPRSDSVDYDEVASFVCRTLPGVAVELKEPLLDREACHSDGLSAESLAVAFARARVRDIMRPQTSERQPLPGEVDFELRRFVNNKSRVFGILYDGWALTDIYRELIAGSELTINCIHVVFTNQLMGTWDSSDRRYHARTVMMGSPAIISTTGLVEAPAKAPGFYIAKNSTAAFGFTQVETMELAQTFAGDHLGHEDQRMTDVAKGYVMQPVAYRVTGEPFCSDDGCRLYNAHWQAEMIRAQIGGGYDFCERHEKALKEFSASGELSWI